MQKIEKNIFSPIAREMDMLAKHMNLIYKKIDRYVLPPPSDFFRRSKGKRIRPAFIFLVWRSLTGRRDENVTQTLLHATAALELLHTSSLIHDDIVDESPIRHNMKSAYRYYDTNRAVVLADDLIAAAMEELSRCRDYRIQAIVSKSFHDTVEGQLREMSANKQLRQTEKEYSRIIEKKTASFFMASFAVGAMEATDDSKKIRQYINAGRHIGLAFQLADDVGDLLGTQKSMGKPSGQDIREGVITLPIMYLLQEVSSKDRAFIRRTLKKPSSERIKKIIQLFRGSSSHTKIVHMVHRHISYSKGVINKAPTSSSKVSLLRILDYIFGSS